MHFGDGDMIEPESGVLELPAMWTAELPPGLGAHEIPVKFPKLCPRQYSEQQQGEGSVAWGKLAQALPHGGQETVYYGWQSDSHRRTLHRINGAALGTLTSFRVWG